MGAESKCNCLPSLYGKAPANRLIFDALNAKEVRYMSNKVVAAMYKFVILEDYVELQAKLKTLCDAEGIKGTLLLAREGINGTVSGTRNAIDKLNAFFVSDGRFDGMSYKESFDE